MQKKKYNLTADLVSLDNESITNRVDENKKKSKHVLITLSVDEEFRYEFKSWCVRHRMKMNEALDKSFVLLKNKYGP
jgi:hypothetical protein